MSCWVWADLSDDWCEDDRKASLPTEISNIEYFFRTI
jgi:hypothetical protein